MNWKFRLLNLLLCVIMIKIVPQILIEKNYFYSWSNWTRTLLFVTYRFGECHGIFRNVPKIILGLTNNFIVFWTDLGPNFLLFPSSGRGCLDHGLSILRAMFFYWINLNWSSFLVNLSILKSSKKYRYKLLTGVSLIHYTGSDWVTKLGYNGQGVLAKLF